MKLGFVAAVAVFLGAAQPALSKDISSTDISRATQHVQALFDGARSVPGAAPAMALVVVAKGNPPLIIASGVADARTGAKADADTPFYIASMTKAYMGLLAAELDRKNILDLDSTVAMHWPELRIPGVDTNAMTLRNLLTQRLLFENETIELRTAYTDEVPVSDYPALLTSNSSPIKPGFTYQNLGYLLYAAALEQKTGRSWKDWLETDVLKPLGLDHTSSRTSDFTVVTAAHQWDGRGWHVGAGKSDAVMHAAGGLVTSPKDMAKWLQAQLEGKAAAIPPSLFAAARAIVPYPAQDRGGRMCDGYAPGWNRCSAHGVPFLEHGGTYPGFRSQMMIAPEAGVGLAVLTNSDSMTGGLSSDLMKHFIKALADPAYIPDVEAFADDYRKKIETQALNRASNEAKDRTNPEWRGWSWHPSASELSAYAGTYRSDALGILALREEGGKLVGSLGALKLDLEPAAPDLFAGRSGPFERREEIRFERSYGGRISALLWGETRFERR